MHLYVMRHGPAEDRAASGRDADRRLTPEGRDRVERVAIELHRIRGGAPEVEVRDELSVDADLPLALVAALARGGADALLVGHQPNVEHLVRTLIDASGRGAPGLALPGFTTALIVALEPDPAPHAQHRWRVARILDPRALA